MTHTEFQTIAAGYGFERVYFTSPMKFDLGKNRFNLIADAISAFPSAQCIAVLIYPYAPFTADERIPAYYLASNRAYYAANALIAELAERGICAKKATIPIKMQLQRSKIGTKCKNSLIAIEPFGTRVVLFALAIDELQPLEYDESGDGCGDCTLCAKRCPTGAISPDGLNVERCMRLHMETALHPDWVRERQRTFIGCEICQYACRRNADIPSTTPTESESLAFELTRLICGDTADARKLVGKNMSGNGRLTAEAIAFAAHDVASSADRSYVDAIIAASDSPFEAVRDAVRYARALISGPK